MSMSILNAEESRKKASLPPLSTGRLLALVFLGLVVFAGSVIVALKVMPGPYRDIDYLIIGTVSVGIGLLVVFLAMLVNRSKLFVRDDEEPAS